MPKQPVNLTDLIQETPAPTSAQDIPVTTPVMGSAQVSVRLDGVRYAKLKKIAISRQTTHKDIMIEAFDLWCKENNIL